MNELNWLLKKYFLQKNKMLEIKVKWIDKLIAKKYSRNLFKWIKSWMWKSLVFIHWVGIKNTPIDKWILRKGFREKLQGLFWKMFNKVKYAHFVNDWTKYQKATWFLEKIRDKSEDKVSDILNTEIEKVIW